MCRSGEGVQRENVRGEGGQPPRHLGLRDPYVFIGAAVIEEVVIALRDGGASGRTTPAGIGKDKDDERLASVVPGSTGMDLMLSMFVDVDHSEFRSGRILSSHTRPDRTFRRPILACGGTLRETLPVSCVERCAA
jgi:hypothetical protein